MSRTACMVVFCVWFGCWPGVAAIAGQVLSGESTVQIETAPPSSSGIKPNESGPAIGPGLGPYSIRGTVVSATTGAPLDHAEITLSTAGQNRMQLDETVASASGGFRFEHLGAGKYTIEAFRRGYITSGYQEHDGFVTALVTGPDLDTDNIRFALLPDGIISGSVLDEFGDPVARAQVSLYRQVQANGESRVVNARMEATDDSGTYEFARLQPGDYYISVSATPWYAFHPPVKTDGSGNPLPMDQQPHSPLDVAYPIVFYPNATDSASASAITLNAGDHIQANVSVHAVAAVHIRIHMPDPGPNHNFSIPQITTNAFGTPVFHSYGAVSMSGKPGNMVADLGGFAPGQYTLRRFGPNGQADGGDLDLTTDQVIDFNPSGDSTDVSGRLAMASGQKLPDGLNAVLIPAGNQGRAFSARVSADGSFDFSNVASGSYEFQVRAFSRSLAVAQMAASAGQVQGSHITVGSDPILLAATLVAGFVTVNGYAESNGRRLGGVMILLVPRDPDASHELYRRDQSDSDGSFTLNRVIPGYYILVAIESGWTLEWGRSEVLAPYLAHGVPIHISNQEGTLNLSEPVAVQDR